MESLQGFGINSILWEEREFWDGGKYYYSPALGQIRLGCPPRMKGGLVSFCVSFSVCLLDGLDDVAILKAGLIYVSLSLLLSFATRWALERRLKSLDSF